MTERISTDKTSREIKSRRIPDITIKVYNENNLSTISILLVPKSVLFSLYFSHKKHGSLKVKKEIGFGNYCGEVTCIKCRKGGRESRFGSKSIRRPLRPMCIV